MNRVIRSIIGFDEFIDTANRTSNYFTFLEFKIIPSLETDVAIMDFVKDFVKDSSDGEPPSITTVRDYFESNGHVDVLERLKECQSSPGYIKSNFVRLCKNLREDQRNKQFDKVLREAAVIKSTGLKEGKKGVLKKGVKDAIHHLLSNTTDLLTVEAKGKLHGDATVEGEEVWNTYQSQKLNPQKAVMTGFDVIDETTKGHRPGEMMLVLGYTGELKTSFCVNYAYNAAILGGHNVMYFSLEMKYEQVRNLLYTIHSTHNKFGSQTVDAVDYAGVRDGRLSPKQEALFRDVCKDMSAKDPNRGSLILERITNRVTLSEIKTRAEMQHQKTPLSLIIIDYAGLIESEDGRNDGNFAVQSNYTMKDLGQFSLNFNQGEGIALCSPFQSNREGWKDACKNDGHYKLTALSWASEAEKSSSLIVYTFLGDTGELREAGECKIGCLKNRDNGHFKQFVASVDFKTRRMRNNVETFDKGFDF